MVKGLYAELTGDEIKEDLARVGIMALRAVQMRKRNWRRTPLPVYLIEVAASQENEQKLLDLTYLAHLGLE